MKKLIVLCIFLILPSAFANARLNEKGNGGDIVLCKKSNKNKFDGAYSLDYILTYNRRNNNADIVKVKSWEKSAERLLWNFETYLPKYYRSFKLFVEYVGNFTDYSAPHVWLDYPGRLIDIKGERLIRRIPRDCQSGSNQIYQGVVRNDNDNYNSPQIEYEIDGDLYDQIGQLPIQFSFLMTHEFLWTIFDNAKDIRTLNRLLHSNILSEFSRYHGIKALSKLPVRSSGLKEYKLKIFNETLNSFFIDSSEQFLKLLKYNYDFDVFSGHASWKSILAQLGLKVPNGKFVTMDQLYNYGNPRISLMAAVFEKEEIFNGLIEKGLIADERIFIQAISLGYGKSDILEKLKDLGDRDPEFYLSNQDRDKH